MAGIEYIFKVGASALRNKVEKECVRVFIKERK